MVEMTLEPGVSVSQVAQAHQVNANLLFLWRRQHREGRLTGEADGMRLLPVTVVDTAPGGESQAVEAECIGSLLIELARGRIRIEGQADESLLRAALEMLLR
jgi:transposase